MAVRPKTLTVAVVPVLVGSALAWGEEGRIVWPVVVAALVGAVLIQAGTNLHNDAADFQRGADDRATRLGPPRVTAEGWLSATEVHRAATLSFVGSGLVGVYLVWVGGWPILLIGLLSIAAGVAYTGGPRPIAYSGFGEFFVWFFFGLVAVSGSYFLQTGRVSTNTLLAGAIIGMPAAAVLVVNNYRDLENDRRARKHTLAVRLGRRASRIEYAGLMLLPFILLAFVRFAGAAWWWTMLPWLVLPWALFLVKQFRTEQPGPGFNRLLASTARFQFVFGLLLCTGIVGGEWWSSNV